MPIIFADPFGSYADGFERGQDQRIQVEEFEQNRRLKEYELYDRFVFSPQQELAKEQRALDQRLMLMAERRGHSANARAERDAGRAVDGGLRFTPMGSGAPRTAAAGGAVTTAPVRLVPRPADAPNFRFPPGSF